MRAIAMSIVFGLLLPLLCRGAGPSELVVTRDGASGRVVAVQVPGVSRAKAHGAQGSPILCQINAGNFLREHGAAFGIADPTRELRAVATKTDKQGFTQVRHLQMVGEVPVFGGEINVHLNVAGEVTSATGSFFPGLTANTQPSLSLDQLRELIPVEWAMRHGNAPELSLGEPSLWVFPQSSQPAGGQLAWRINATWQTGELVQESEDYLLDAHSGKQFMVLDQTYELYRQEYDCNTYPASCYINMWRSQYQYWFGRSEPYGIRGPHPIPGLFFGSNDVDNLHEYFGQVHNYYWTTFGRDGANEVGGTGAGPVPTTYTRGLVHLDDQTGPATAAWSNQGKVQFSVGMVVPDIMGHEYSHGIPFFSFRDLNGNATGAVYLGETGALNEAWADLAGNALEQQISGGLCDWTLGTSFLAGGVPIGTPMGARRPLFDPSSMICIRTNLPYPERFMSSSFYCGENDNQGVHDNSPVPGYSMYLLTVGSLFNGCEIPAIGFDAVQQIWYRAWTEYFTSTETFNGAYPKLLLACEDLYGQEHPEYVTALQAALQAVEMDQPGRCSGIPEVAPACAVIGGGAAWTGLANGDADSLFTDSESIWLHSATGVPGRRVLVHRLVPGTEPGLWEEILSGTDSLSVTVGMDGVLAASLGCLPAGDWTLLLDGDHDGFWQPWADQQLHVSVSAVPPQVTGLSARAVSHDGTVDRIQLNWNRLPGALPSTLYLVEGDTMPQFTLPQLLVATPDTTWTDSLSVTTMPLRVYRVKAVTP